MGQRPDFSYLGSASDRERLERTIVQMLEINVSTIVFLDIDGTLTNVPGGDVRYVRNRTREEQLCLWQLYGAGNPRQDYSLSDIRGLFYRLELDQDDDDGQTRDLGLHVQGFVHSVAMSDPANLIAIVPVTNNNQLTVEHLLCLLAGHAKSKLPKNIGNFRESEIPKQEFINDVVTAILERGKQVPSFFYFEDNKSYFMGLSSCVRTVDCSQDWIGVLLQKYLRSYQMTTWSEAASAQGFLQFLIDSKLAPFAP
jgi:hypothetical protein